MVTFTQDEWDALIAAYPLGTSVAGRVVSCQLFGVFVQIEELPHVTALLEVIHFAALVSDPRHSINYPADYPQVG